MATTPDDELTRAILATSAVTTGPDRVSTPGPHGLTPGAIVAGRYRLVGLLGRGGMGEVYRADDLTLELPVALKFLPASVAAGDARLTQFHNELKTARQVSHKNVCRLYDLGEADGRRFLTMEYVDGEDLASLLRRIGRIPQDKAVDIARQLCAGIAAAHERGVIHRDLKPSNVMIDGEGNVRITDFGIATATAETGDGFIGTPQYMAPELFAGRTASIKSDIYALGLILFEIFTGRRAVESKTLGDLKSFHETGAVTTPSSIVPDLDPAVERVILRCLENDPNRRPASALVVAAALPGADPLGAALAAGETPSPEILAAAGETEVLGVLPGVTMVTLAVVGLVAFALLSSRSSIVGRVPLDLPPTVLVDRAEQVIGSLGYPRASGDQAYGFVRAGDYTRWLFETRSGPDRYDPIASGNPSAIAFWYRTAPMSLQPLTQARVSLTDPSFSQTDMRAVLLDGRGRLQEFRSVPPQVDPTGDAIAAPPWQRAFEAAGLQISAFTPATPQWTPRDYADTRAAWEGPLADDQTIRVRVEASAYRGKVTYFSIIGPWTRPTIMQPIQQTLVDRVIAGALTIVISSLFVVAGLLARRNLRGNRADRRGAKRLATFTAAVGVLAWLLGAHHAGTVQAEYASLFDAAAKIAVLTVMLWAIYLSLEPYVRRLWPDGLLGWSRLISGHIRDARVGRDVLIGVTVGAALSLVDVARATIIPWLGYPAPTPTYGRSLDMLVSPGTMTAAWLQASTSAVQWSLLQVFIVVLVRLTLRRPVLAIPVTALILGGSSMAQAGTTTTSLVFVFGLVSGALLTLLILRSGVLAFAIAWFVWTATTNAPLMQDLSHWSASAGNWTLAVLIALVAFGYYASRAGQLLFGAILKD